MDSSSTGATIEVMEGMQQTADLEEETLSKLLSKAKT